MALTPQQEQDRLRYNASVGPEYQLSPHQYQTFASQGHQMGAPAAGGQSASSGGSASGGYPSGYAGPPIQPTWYVPPGTTTQATMMAGNAQAANIAPGSIPAGDYIEPSAYSSIGSGPSRLGATNPQQAVNDYREHLARESARQQAERAAKINDPYNIAYQQQQAAKNNQVPMKRQVAANQAHFDRKYGGLDNTANAAAVQEAIAAQAAEQAANPKQPTTAKEKAQALYNDPNTPALLKHKIEQQGWLDPAKRDFNSLQAQSIEQAYTQQFPNGVPAPAAPGATSGPQSAAEAAMAAAQAASQTFAAQSGTAPPIASPYGAATGTASQPVPGSNIYNDLLATYQSAYDQIQQGEEERRQTHQQGQAERTQAVLDRLAGLGTQEREDVNLRYDQAGSATTQSAISRGLYNTTVLDNLQRGVEQDRNRALRQVEEGLQREELGYLTQLTGDELSAYERPTAVPPDLSQLIALSQGVGAAGPVNGAGGTAAPTSQPAPAATGAASPYAGSSVQPSASAQPTPSASAQPAPQAGQPAGNPDDQWRQSQIQRHMEMGHSQAEAERLFEIGNDPKLKQQYQSASRSERNAMLNPQATAQPVAAPSATAQPQQQAGGSSPFSFSQGYQSPYAEAQAAAQPQQGVGREPMAAYPNSGSEGPSIDGNAHMRARLQQAANDRVAGAQPVAAPIPAPTPAAAKPPVSVPTSPYNPMTIGAPRPAQPPHAPPPGQKWMKNAKGGYQLANAAAPMW